MQEFFSSMPPHPAHFVCQAHLQNMLHQFHYTDSYNLQHHPMLPQNNGCKVSVERSQLMTYLLESAHW